jgi:polyamine oxidase
MLSLAALLNSSIVAAAGLRSQQVLEISRKAVSSSKIEKYYDIVIIGAGWAGLAAANTLFRQNVTNFTVLEARPYIGGRSVTSFTFGSDTPVDLGSSWVHGIINNPVQALVDKYGVKYGEATQSQAVYFSNSTRLSDALVDQLCNNYYSEGSGFLSYDDRKQRSASEDRSMANTVSGYISVKHMNVLQKREFDWLVDTNVVQEYAADLSELSTRWWDVDLELSGGDTFLGVVGGGYSTVVNRYASAVLPYIQLNTSVLNVDYSSAQTLVTYNKTGILETISASKVIVTLPLGVLKAGMETNYFIG